MNLINRNTQNYWIIGVLSAILVIFLPMAGSVAGLAWVFPTTVAGWVVYIVLKLAATGLNMMIFHHFVVQAKVNIKDDPRFLEAERLLQNFMDESIPLSPKTFFSKQYRKKGFTLCITTLLSTICITQAILTFDYISFIVHLIAVVFAIIFGIQTMREDEEFWTVDYLKYAKYTISHEKDLASDNHEDKTTVHERVSPGSDSGRTAILESTDSTGDTVNLQTVDVESGSNSVQLLGVSATSDSNSSGLHISNTHLTKTT